jgi:hypothetical protein
VLTDNSGTDIKAPATLCNILASVTLPVTIQAVEVADRFSKVISSRVKAFIHIVVID